MASPQAPPLARLGLSVLQIKSIGGGGFSEKSKAFVYLVTGRN